jgi:hypothetical protein
MDDLETWLSRIGEDARFDDEAVARLEARLSTEPGPRTLARRRLWAGSLAFAAIASLAGAAMGAFLEVQRTPPTAALLPAAQSGTAAALLFGEG